MARCDPQRNIDSELCVFQRGSEELYSSISNGLFIMSNTGQNKICLHFFQFYLEPESQIQTQELSSKQCRCTDYSSLVR